MNIKAFPGVVIIAINGDLIKDWDSFHSVFKKTFGFFDGYGCNMNAWIDCMGDIDKPDTGMTKIHIEKDGLLVIKLENANMFKERCPEQYDALVDCIAFVNQKSYNIGNSRDPIIALMPVHEEVRREKRWIM